MRPYQLLQVLKGAYGLVEATRLWYLQARNLVTDIGFKEIRMARAVFTYMVGNVLKAWLVLPVDDGMLSGDEEDPDYQLPTAGL